MQLGAEADSSARIFNSTPGRPRPPVGGTTPTRPLRRPRVSRTRWAIPWIETSNLGAQTSPTRGVSPLGDDRVPRPSGTSPARRALARAACSRGGPEARRSDDVGDHRAGGIHHPPYVLRACDFGLPSRPSTRPGGHSSDLRGPHPLAREVEHPRQASLGLIDLGSAEATDGHASRRDSGLRTGGRPEPLLCDFIRAPGSTTEVRVRCWGATRRSVLVREGACWRSFLELSTTSRSQSTFADARRDRRIRHPWTPPRYADRSGFNRLPVTTGLTAPHSIRWLAGAPARTA